MLVSVTFNEYLPLLNLSKSQELLRLSKYRLHSDDANPRNNFLFERAETVRDVIGPVSGDTILMSKQSMHAALLGAARACLAPYNKMKALFGIYKARKKSMWLHQLIARSTGSKPVDRWIFVYIVYICVVYWSTFSMVKVYTALGDSSEQIYSTNQ